MQKLTQLAPCLNKVVSKHRLQNFPGEVKLWVDDGQIAIHACVYDVATHYKYQNNEKLIIILMINN